MNIKAIFSTFYFKIFILLVALTAASLGRIYFNLSNNAKLEKICNEIVKEELFEIDDLTSIDKVS